MVWINLIVGAHALHNITMEYVNVVNSIATFVEPTPSTNTTTNYTILTQYSIKQVLQVFEKKLRLQCENNLQYFHDRIVVDPKKPCILTYEHRGKILAYQMFLKIKSYEVSIK